MKHEYDKLVIDEPLVYEQDQLLQKAEEDFYYIDLKVYLYSNV